MHEQWTMPPFKVTLRKLVTDSDIYELLVGSDRYGHEILGSIALIQGRQAALKRFEEEKMRLKVEVAKIAMRLA